MNKLQRMLGIATIFLAGCSTTDNRPTITWREVHENPECYNLFEYDIIPGEKVRILSDEEALKERGSSQKDARKYLEAQKAERKKMLCHHALNH